MHTKTKRLLSLDVLRGITIAGMILVNTIVLSPYPNLDHAQWNGCTCADLVFPFFLVVVGLSLALSITKELKSGASKTSILHKIIKRSLIIFGLGMLLNFVPHHLTSESFGTVRVYGVLQRVALCYFFAALAYLYMSTLLQAVLFMTLIVGYWLFMTYFPVPGFGPGNLSPGGDLGAYLDRCIFNATNLYGKVFDPEGLFSTLPAIASTLMGNLCGIWLLSRKSQERKWSGISAAGVLSMCAGWMWGQWFPINKALWTSSYVLWTGGIALLSFGICYRLIEINHHRRWCKPFEIFGLNAIAAYFLHVLFFKIQLMIHVTCAGKICNLRQAIIHDLFSWTSLPYASLYYAIMSVLFWFLVLSILYLKKIFIRI